MRNLEVIKRDALAQRLKGLGGKRVHWTSEQKAHLQRVYMSAPESAFRALDNMKDVARGDGGLSDLRIKLIGDGTISASGDTAGSLSFVFRITCPDIDLQGDSLKAGCISTKVFQGNPLVLSFHDSGRMPIAKSSMPWTPDDSTLARATFPEKGVSKESDEVVAMVRAGYLRGASVGFIPIKYSFSKDPSRPLGIDFTEVLLLEWSICSLPANSACLLVGASATKRAAPSKPKAESTREQRMDAVRTLRGVLNV
jgi:HK97 family phage prohead protease